MKKFTIVLFAGFVLSLSISCSKNSGANVDLSVSDEEKAQGWRAFQDMGFKVQIPELILQNKNNIDSSVIGDENDDSEAVYKAHIYRFAPDSVISAYNTIVNDEAMTREQKIEKLESEVYSKIKTVFALAAVRTNLINAENTVEKILDFKDCSILRKTDKFTHVICFGNSSDTQGLPEDEAEKFKNLIASAKNISANAKLADPVTKEQALTEIKNLKFKTTDLNGNEVSSDIFAKADVTMVNIWATWCPPCKAELPEIGNLARKYAAKNCAVIGICSDVTDTDDSALDKAKEILADSNCEFLNLKKNASLDKIYANIQAYPTTMFFDKNGNIVGDIIVGSRTEADFEKAFEAAIASLKK